MYSPGNNFSNNTTDSSSLVIGSTTILLIITLSELYKVTLALPVALKSLIFKTTLASLSLLVLSAVTFICDSALATLN